MSKEHIIYKVTPGSIAEELEIEAGDVLVSVNGKEIEDVFVVPDYGKEHKGCEGVCQAHQEDVGG